jgi:hypothetical protein
MGRTSYWTKCSRVCENRSSTIGPHRHIKIECFYAADMNNDAKSSSTGGVQQVDMDRALVCYDHGSQRAKVSLILQR